MLYTQLIVHRIFFFCKMQNQISFLISKQNLNSLSIRSLRYVNPSYNIQLSSIGLKISVKFITFVKAVVIWNKSCDLSESKIKLISLLCMYILCIEDVEYHIKLFANMEYKYVVPKHTHYWKWIAMIVWRNIFATAAGLLIHAKMNIPSVVHYSSSI